ncbi:transposase [Paraburkholderia fungorum]|uniref:Transposase n=1 Tax=Paraburkholderia fungorum TaxID=134537 RepID=A0A1H1JWG3_9BURK|nr:transposase [Paraburkholderia fungorum]
MNTWTTSKVVQDFVRIPGGSGFGANQQVGVAESVLRRWVRQLHQEWHGITPQSPAMTPEQQRIQELEARVERLEREKTILKKATALLMSEGIERTK